MDYFVYTMDSTPFEQDELYGKCLELVSAYRKDKVQRLRRMEDRAASLAAGCLLSYALRVYAGIDEQQVVYIKNKSGKPAIIDNSDEQFGLGNKVDGADPLCAAAYRNIYSDVQFSISHTDGCVAVVIGKKACGIDVERVRRIPDSIINRMYSDEDSEQIKYIECKGKKADLYSTTVWTRREAYGKMTGTGLLMSDPDQKNVMQDEYMLKKHTRLASYGIYRYNKECSTAAVLETELLNTDRPEGIKEYDYVTSVSVSAQDSDMKFMIIDHHDVIAELS